MGEQTSEAVAFSLPGPSRVLTREEIAAEYGDRATRPIPPGYTKRRTYAQRHEEQRFLPYSVYKIFDSGAKEFVSKHLTESDALIAAGKKRDEMTDDECGKDFTFLAERSGRGKRSK